ncbi:MAG: hypothetical protein K6G83_10890, partial [Lachnospiraceae bacterium]|nr:hypothetical protein [Lachnospiraceae bacterium]
QQMAYALEQIADALGTKADANKVYGIEIDKNDSNPATRVHYIDDAQGFTPMQMNLTTGVVSMNDWEGSFPIKSFRPVMLKSDGTVDYELHHEDQRYKLDGVTASDISNTAYDGNAMVGRKPIYVYRHENENYIYKHFSKKKQTDDFKCFANLADDGVTVLDECFSQMFEGCNVNNVVRSLAGQTPMNNVAGATEISYAEANGSGWTLDDWSHRKLIEDLLQLLYRSTDIQAANGNGHYSGGSQASHLLQTGSLKDKGMFYGTSGNVASKVFWMENFYGDRWDRIHGCVLISGEICIKMRPPYNQTGDGYIHTGVTLSGTSGGYISQMKGTEYGDLPKVVSGSDSTYWPDGM